MKSRLVYLVLAVLGLGGLGWFAYTSQKNPGSFGFELKGAAPAADGAAASGKSGGDGAKAGPDGKPTAGGPPAGGGQGGPGGAGRPSGPVGVEVAKVVKTPVIDEAIASGTLRANETVTLRSEVAGRVVRLGFTDGARVGKGAILVALDASLSAAEAEQARAELSLSKANFDRTAELAQRNFVSASAKDQAAANLKVQEAKLKLAEAKLAKSDIRAPFNGVMGLRNLSPGDFVKDGADLAIIEDISTMKVDVRLPERYFGRVKPGMAILLTLDSMPGKTFTAKLTAVDAQIDANGRSLLARGQLANPDGALRTGMFARARLVLRENPDALVIPEEALIPQGAEVFVYRVDAGKAMRTTVKPGSRTDGKVEILSGLAEGDQVVTAGQLRLQRDGQEVRIIDPSRRPGGGPPGAKGGGPAGAGANGAPAAGGGAPSGGGANGGPPGAGSNGTPAGAPAGAGSAPGTPAGGADRGSSAGSPGATAPAALAPAALAPAPAAAPGANAAASAAPAAPAAK
jgi:membrane fusion protein, multidrug efflux system